MRGARDADQGRPGGRAPDPLATVRDLLAPDEAGGSGGTFLRGLTVGALIGAAIAGSAIWQRRRGVRSGGDGRHSIERQVPE